ncbi:MAG: hypothetical protein ACM34M_06320 [Ignavibacteria bacterium]
MRSLILFILFAAFNAVQFAQEETLIEFGDQTGGFGGPVAKFTSINSRGAIMLGARGGWIFDHSFVVGGGIYTLVSEVDAPENILPAQGPLDIDFSYFGLEAEYVLQPSSLIHYNFYLFVGAGAVRFLKDVGSFSKNNTQVEETDLTFVLEPAANAELNVTDWCRVMAGVSYRITTGVTQVGLKNSDFTGLAASLTAKFGSF